MLEENLNHCITLLGSADRSVWILGIICLASLTLGALAGRFYWLQEKDIAGDVRMNTRKNQSDFDLVNRDITKIRQEATARVTEPQPTRTIRWKR